MSDKTVAEKAHIKPGTCIAVVAPAAGVVESLGLPEDVAFVEPDAAQLVFVFVNSQGELDERLPAAVAALRPGSAVWVFFRKGAAAKGLDMNRDSVWSLAEKLDLRPLGLVSVDTEWSAFRLRPARDSRSGA